MPIDIRTLPREIQDIIELKEATDMTFGRFLDNDYSETFWDKMYERSRPDVEHSMIVSLFGSQGSGKSMTGLSMCLFMDPFFSIENIFFRYDDLVYNRHKLRDNSAVLIDEQSETYGLDAHRINILLSNLKEQLRKRSIHLFFCSPVLYPEHKSSMYLVETMWIDYETREVVAALRTRDELTLGNIRVPHPELIFEDEERQQKVKALLVAYQKKKDEHLERLLGKKHVDPVDERAENTCNHPLFRKAEKVYLKQMGYIPSKAVVQLINKIFPEFQGNVMSIEIADRIRLNKEMSGKWNIAGRKVSRKQRGN